MSTLNFIHTVTGDFNAAVFTFLKSQEGFVPRVYLDGKNSIAIGYGYDLLDRGKTPADAKKSTRHGPDVVMG